MIPMLDPQTLTVFVTGATAGFGAALCRRFAEAGARVIGSGRRRDRLDALRAELGERLHVLELDVTDRAAVLAAVESLPAGFDAPNVCIANAGLALGLAPAQEADLDDWDRMIATNVNGLAYTVRALLPGMVARDEGHVVLLGSVAGDYPYPGGNVYGATKAFVKQFALNLRADLLGSNVRVTNIEPGMAETEFSLVRFQGDAAKAAKTYEGVAAMSAEDIAETIFWSCTLPRHLNINRMQMMPVMQAFSPFAVKRG
ncbi:short-chain dehydrogenase/reductase SDR [Methylobacterium sp. 4-46]|uniref:SDR family NAD(P)-dependent oxidoreductase n=1 Tax=unclassified Methylobacterium TaxID=2615210 RepID=UPI000152C7E8|nr:MULTISPECIES: SDR family NAD(P)-dependent oxidoreductase [Methylobacterium]ACA15387.1 short-chain dehydrogenase/reductase SDR [Methylobacterium sp. 4-46]WFT81108.1 SDR family NAD(P)-dependent oxidoreductase [Methylobacterium nodulans]